MKPTALQKGDSTKKIDAAIESHFAQHATQRAYVMTDKPLYQPGETIYYRADVRATGTMIGQTSQVTMQLVSPRGAIVAQHVVPLADGVATNGFDLAGEIDGGEYTLRMTAPTGTVDEHKIVINTYEAPRLQKSIEFVRKAYGAGDTVTAAVEIKRATGEPLANKTVQARVSLDDKDLSRTQITTDKDGKAIVKFQLPATIDRGDGLLSLLVDDGGVTEAMQKRVPIVTTKIGFAMFPEGGDLVEGLPGRVYFSAVNTMGKPADVEGRVLDDRGQEVATFTSIHDGMGRFEVQPAADRTYHVEITKPANIAQKFDLPAAKAGGCVLRGMDSESRVAALCTTARTLEVEAVLREKRVAGGEIEVAAGKPAVIDLPIEASAQGAVRVTLFSTKNEPLAERLVYHGRGHDMKVAITADRKSYGPRDPVKLHVTTTDESGKPVAANVGVAVVDDTVLSFADDKSGRLLAHMYLDDELGARGDANPIEEPNYYFGDKPNATAAMDALLATRGYRRFEWQPVFSPPPPMTVDATGMAWGRNEEVEGAVPAPMPPAPPPAAPANAKRPVVVAKPAAAHVNARDHAAGPVEKAAKEKGKDKVAQDLKKANAEAPRAQNRPVRGRGGGKMEKQLDFEGDDGDFGGEVAMVMAPVRVFPVPQYPANYSGPRTDFRETIYWNGNVKTSESGAADVSFVTSDAVTSFRATVEGVSAGGLLGTGAAVIQNKLPMTLDVHLPTEVTSGDLIRLPVTVANETDHDLDAQLAASFGKAFTLEQDPLKGGKLHLAAGEKKSLYYPLRVVATDGEGNVDIALDARGLEDKLHKAIRVVPMGFPFEVSASGTASAGKVSRHELALDGAMPGSISATVTMYPSPLASMTQGMAAMIREPGGCFEQTSSTNYPNIMILGYLQANDAADPALIASATQKLDHGYKLLTGYETPEKGYEWFGKNPGHEALTAYGLMEFADMGKVYDVDKTMVERTAKWLDGRRDGKGGFKRSTEALDSFGRASETTTNAYIMWALAQAKRTAGMDKELAAQKELGGSTSDPYLLALASNTNLITSPAEGKAMVKRLAAMQGKDGSFPGAKESITMSGGESLAIETTALATIAMLNANDGAYEGNVRAAVDWLNGKRGGYGEWGNTQATILGLKALTAYAEHSRVMQAAGTATLIVNGKEAGTIAFDKGRKEALVWDNVAKLLTPGKNVLELRVDGGATLPYTMTVDYRSARPQSSANAKVSLATSIAKSNLKMGDGVKLHAHVENKTQNGVPMTLARVGIPGGLVYQTWQLKELKDKGLIDFYETRPREVVLYWRALAPSAKKDVDLDLLAQVAGSYEAPASSAYLYYTAEDKAWTAPVKVNVER